jgi:hypothetical protein
VGTTGGRHTDPADDGVRRAARGQSEVVGVALMLGITVLALGALTATIGGVVQQQASGADAARVSTDVDHALRPVETTGAHRGDVAISGGQLSVVDREIRIMDGGTTVRTVDAGALVYRHGDRRVAFVAGAVVRGSGERARFRREPPVSADGRAVVVGAPALNESGLSVGAAGQTTVVLRTNVTHHRTTLGDGNWRVAVETATPAPWRPYLEGIGANVTTRDLDGDGVPSVVARFDGRRTAYLVVHAMRLEVDARG